jgi:hypothetical protein
VHSVINTGLCVAPVSFRRWAKWAPISSRGVLDVADARESVVVSDALSGAWV